MNFVKLASKMQERFPSAVVSYGDNAEVLSVCLADQHSLADNDGALRVGMYPNARARLCVLCGCPENAHFSGNVVALSEADVPGALKAAVEIFSEDVQLSQCLAELLRLYTLDSSERALVNLLAKQTGCHAVLLDMHFMIQCQSGSPSEIQQALSEYTFRTFPFISEAGKLKDDSSADQASISDTFVTHIHDHEKTCGYFILLNVPAPVPTLVSELSRTVAKLLGKNMSSVPVSPIPMANENILLELLNTTHPTMDLRLRMRGAGLRFDQPKRVVVFDANMDDPLFESVRSSLPAGYTTRFKNALVLLVDAEEGAAWGQQREAFKALAEEYQLHVGISDVFSGSMNVSLQCRNAFQAIAFADQFNIGADILDYSDFRFFDLLSVFDQPRELFRYMHPALQKLRDIDAKSGAVYFHTLHCFLKYNANLSQTAKVLFIHRNTLNYRLKRIEELTGLALEDHKTRFTLNYSYHIAEYLGLVDF